METHNKSKDTPLANLGEISSGETDGALGKESQVDIRSNGSLSEVGLEDLETRCLIGQRNVDQLVETTGTEDGRVYDIGSVRGSDNEHILLAVHSIHLSKDLIDDTIGSSSSVSD